MSVNWMRQTHSGLRQLVPYQPGKSLAELQRATAIDDAIKLASNENPRGPSQKVIAAITEGLGELCRYPDGHELTCRLAERLNLPVNQIILGNGSNDVLDLVARVFLAPERSAIVSEHCFLVYPIVVRLAGATLKEVPAKDHGHHLEAMLSAVDQNTGVVFIANPNNPTGTWLTHNDIKTCLDSLPEEVVLVLDEAYCEYIQHPDYPDSEALLQQYDNLIVTRTFSKVYGLAAARIGYGVCHPEIAELLNRARQPFNVNGLALNAAIAALEDDNYIAESIRLNTRGLQQIEEGLNRLDLPFIPSLANFISFSLGSKPKAATVYQDLLKQGVIVRPIANYAMPDYLRVTIGLPEENDRFLKALGSLGLN